MRPSLPIAVLLSVFILGPGLTPCPVHAGDSPVSQGTVGEVLRQLGVPVPGGTRSYAPSTNPYATNPGNYGQLGLPYPVNPGNYGQAGVPYQINPGNYGQTGVPYPVNPGRYGQPGVPYPVNPGNYGQPGVSYPVNPGNYGQAGVPYPITPGSYGQPGFPNAVNPGGYSSGYNQPGATYPAYPGDPQVQPPFSSGVVWPNPSQGLSQLVALSDQLISQADTFLRAFAPTSRIVPEGGQFISDTQSLRDSAIRFRQAAASSAPPPVLSAALQNIQAGWQRLNARLLRISKGNIGPNIANALQMGRTVEQMRGSF